MAKKMIRVSRTWAVVVGDGRFPLDMLRYDGCHPDRGEDSAKIEPQSRDLRAVVLVRFSEGSRNFTKERWESFGWSVSFQADEPGECYEMCRQRNKS